MRQNLLKGDIMEKADILSMNKEEICDFLTSLGEAKFRGKQVFKQLHGRKRTSFDEMTDLSLSLREKLKETSGIFGVKPVEKYKSSLDSTIKYLFEIRNGYIIESVLMKYDYGYSVCVSTQAGCRMGCAFCASTIGGLERSLTAGEILSQVYEIERQENIRVGHVVMMGCGEPLDNFDNSVRFISLLSDPEGANVSRRNITLSTCGLVDEIYRLKDLHLPITLAVSLHAPNNEIRRKIMPVARKYSYDDVIKAAADYAEGTKRRVTFEYALIKGVNDSEKAAYELVGRLKGVLGHVNLIPVNDVKERNFSRSSDSGVKKFSSILTAEGIENTVRRRLGSDINAACGQLRKRYKNNSEVKTL